MDRRSVLAMVLCFIIFVAWQKLYIEPRQTHYAQTAPQTTTMREADTTAPVATTSQESKSAPAKAPPLSVPNQTLQIATGTGNATLGNGADFFVDWNLKSYKLGISPEAAAVDMRSVTNRPGEVEFAFDDERFLYLKGVTGSLVKTASGAVWTYEDSKIKLTREFTSSDNQPYVDLKISGEFKGGQPPRYAFLSVSSMGPEKDPEAQDRQLIYWTNNSIERVRTKDASDIKGIETTIKYIGASNRYFLAAVVSEGDLEPRGLIQPLASELPGERLARASMRFPVAGNSFSIPVRVYFGPKEVELLRTVEPTLNHAVDFGWFEIFAYPLLMILKWIDQFVKNFGVSIIILTVLLKLVTYPLTFKSMKSMREMAKLQPQLQKLREKYKDDREALNREMMVMMRSHGYNPVAGCLPVLIQMPVFFALYRVLYNSIELYQAPFIFWIQDLSRPDRFYVTPILMSVMMFFQQKLTPNTAADPAQQKMMQFMPLIFGVFMLGLPAGLTLYMLVNSLTSIAQQMILNKKLGPVSGARAVTAQ